MSKRYAVVIHDDTKLDYKVFYRFDTKEMAEALYKAHKRKNEPIQLIEYEVIKKKFKGEL